MTFQLHYVVAEADAGPGLAVPGDGVVTVGHETESGRSIEFSIFAEAGGVRVATDVDATAVLRGDRAAAAEADAWILDRAARAVRVHELVHHRWAEVSSERHRSDVEALTRWLTRLDPAGDYWADMRSPASRGVADGRPWPPPGPF